MTRARDVAKQDGLTLIVPTSITVGSGSGSVAANGAITFSGTTSIAVDGVFSSNYQNYKLVWNLNSSSADFYSYFQYRKASVTNAASTGYLFTVFYSDSNAASGAFTYSTGMNAALISYGGRSGYPSSGSVDVYSPMISRYTTLTGLFQTSYGTTTQQQLAALMTASTHLVNDTFDGFIISSGGSTNFTGTLRVYGYNNGA